jgi:hypothetical protein
MHLLAHSAGVHTCYTPDCMNLVPVLLTWHSALYNQQPLHTIYNSPFMPHASLNYFGRVGHGNGLNTRNPLQLLLKLTLSARLLHCLCCHVVLKHLALL